MSASWKVVTAEDIGRDMARRAFALDVLKGLSETPKRLNSRWIYDAEGSRLFAEICNLDEYYPTRCETEILTKHAKAILETTGDGALDLVDLGAGDGRKTGIVIEQARAMQRDLQFVPIDISEAAMKELVEKMGAKYDGLPIDGLVAEYFDGLHWLSRNNERSKLVLFLGSNIGNFNKPQARAFLRQLWDALNEGDYILIGFDLKKDIETLLWAYNDKSGTTAAFDLNLLARINRDLGGDFDLSQFRHFATYNVFSGAMESYLVSKTRQQVLIRELKQTFEFQPWEPVHTEYSYKYLDSDIMDLASSTGFTIVDRFYDSKHWFTDSLWRVEKHDAT